MIFFWRSGEKDSCTPLPFGRQFRPQGRMNFARKVPIPEFGTGRYQVYRLPENKPQMIRPSRSNRLAVDAPGVSLCRVWCDGGGGPGRDLSVEMQMQKPKKKQIR